MGIKDACEYSLIFIIYVCLSFPTKKKKYMCVLHSVWTLDAKKIWEKIGFLLYEEVIEKMVTGVGCNIPY